MQQNVGVQPPLPIAQVPQYMQSYGHRDALGIMMMMQQMQMQHAFLQNLARQNAEQEHSAAHTQVTPLASKILAREDRNRVEEYEDNMMHVPVRQRTNATRVGHGPEKKLTFLLPHTPVDLKKYGENHQDDDDVAVAEMLVHGAQTALTPGSIRYTTPGGRGKVEHTPGRVASTPMAIEVLSQLYNQQAQNDYSAPKFEQQYEEEEEDEDAYIQEHPSKSKRSRRSAANSRAKPTTAAMKAARAASLAVARPRKSISEGPKSCNCKRSQCLKMYCECFAASGYCAPGCSCEACKNTEDNVDLVNMARAGILMKDPTAFDEKVDKSDGHKKGCRCKRSKCLKKYCECYNAGVKCNPAICQCVGCHNADFNSEEDPKEQPETIQTWENVKPEKNGSGVEEQHEGIDVHGEGFNIAFDATQKSTQEEISLVGGILKEMNDREPTELSASALVSHIQDEATPQLPAEDGETATSPLYRVKGVKPRRITNISETNALSQEDTGLQSKRPKRAASNGVSGAIAAAKLGLGFDSKWDTITPPVKVKNMNKHRDIPQKHADISMPLENLPKNYPKKKEAKLLLLQALEKEKAAIAASAEVDAMSALVNLHTK